MTPRKPAKRRPRLDNLGRWRCTKCRHFKPACEFYVSTQTGKPRSWCRVCFNISIEDQRSTEQGRMARLAKYASDPAERERRKLYKHNHGEVHRARKRLYNSKPRSKLVAARCRNRLSLERATDPRLRARIAARLANIEHELAKRPRLTIIDDDAPEVRP